MVEHDRLPELVVPNVHRLEDLAPHLDRPKRVQPHVEEVDVALDGPRPGKHLADDALEERHELVPRHDPRVRALLLRRVVRLVDDALEAPIEGLADDAALVGLGVGGPYREDLDHVLRDAGVALDGLVRRVDDGPEGVEHLVGRLSFQRGRGHDEEPQVGPPRTEDYRFGDDLVGADDALHHHGVELLTVYERERVVQARDVAPRAGDGRVRLEEVLGRV